MNKEKQRIAIAEACGWRIQGHVTPECKEGAILCWIRPNGNEWQPEELPDYLNDLNAIHAAEKVLTKIQRIKYVSYLLTRHTLEEASMWVFCHASASKRAEAFLRCLNLWKD